MEEGKLLRTFTYNDSNTLQDLHGMRYQYNETNDEGYVWVTDVGDGNILHISNNLELHLIYVSL